MRSEMRGKRCRNNNQKKKGQHDYAAFYEVSTLLNSTFFISCFLQLKVRSEWSHLQAGRRSGPHCLTHTL